jgi:hypothetical protein
VEEAGDIGLALSQWELRVPSKAPFKGNSDICAVRWLQVITFIYVGVGIRVRWYCLRRAGL